MWIKNKKAFHSILVVLVIVGAFAVIVATKPAPTPPVLSGGVSTLVAEAATYDFGAVPLNGGFVRRVYAVQNTGTEPIILNGMYTSCMCTTAVMRKGNETWGPYGMPGHGIGGGRMSVALASGEAAEIEAIFDPAAHGPAGVGPVARSIYLENSAGAPVELSFTAIVTP
ncbi:MAG: DUF1573 domain-containing protein [Candidatus Brennerbacteria bacterium]|nr:DUF1573 domain-containing protein [Candidatus Brennerbacteria bacterium]